MEILQSGNGIVLNPVGYVHSVMVYVYSQCMLQGNIWSFKGFLQNVLSFRAHWSVLKQRKIRATSTSRLASMKTPSNVTQRPSVCVPMSRRRTYRRFIRTEQLHLNSRLATNSLRDLSNQTYDLCGMKTLLCASFKPRTSQLGFEQCLNKASTGITNLTGSTASSHLFNLSDLFTLSPLSSFITLLLWMIMQDCFFPPGWLIWFKELILP